MIKTLHQEDEHKASIRDSKSIDEKYGFTRGASYFGGKSNETTKL